jgi:hypothetical protein
MKTLLATLVIGLAASLGSHAALDAQAEPGKIEPTRPVPNCDCAPDGQVCQQPMPLRCQTGGDCTGCSGILAGEQCNDPDAWDWSDCVPKGEKACSPATKGTCVDNICRNEMTAWGTACESGKKAKQCEN